MLWVYDYYNFSSSLTAGIDFRCQNLTSIDEAVWPDHFSVKMALRALISSEFSRGEYYSPTTSTLLPPGLWSPRCKSKEPLKSFKKNTG